MLMKSAERELSEIERKKQAAETVTQQARPRSLVDINREKLLDLEKQIEVESRKLATVRSQLQKTKSIKASDGSSSATGLVGKKASEKSNSTDKSISIPKPTGIPQRPVPEDTLPELCA